MDAMSVKGALGKRMPPDGGEPESSRERGKGDTLGELKEVGGADPDE